MIPHGSTVSVYTLFSSSAGNSIFVTDGKTKFLIDAGCSMKRISCHLSRYGASLSDIKDIFITHEHTDHISALERICKSCEINVRAVGLSAGKLGVDGVIRIGENESTALGGFTVTPFRLSHDTVYCAGYRVRHENGAVIAVMTDTGYVTEEAKNALAFADAVILESNYDEKMLANGPYPPDVKRRISSDRGHLSNGQAAEILPYLYGYGTRRVLLAHISKENNTKEKAYERSMRAAEEHGLTGLSIECADRDAPTRLI